MLWKLFVLLSHLVLMVILSAVPVNMFRQSQLSTPLKEEQQLSGGLAEKELLRRQRWAVSACGGQQLGLPETRGGKCFAVSPFSESRGDCQSSHQDAICPPHHLLPSPSWRRGGRRKRSLVAPLRYHLNSSSPPLHRQHSKYLAGIPDDCSL